MKPRFLQVHWLRRAHSFAAAGTGLVAAGTERGHCGRGGRAGGSRAPGGRGRPAAVSPTPGPEWARPRLPGGGLAFPALQLPPACPEAAAQAPSRAAGRRRPRTQSGLGRGCAGLSGAGAKPPLPLPSGPCQGHLPRSPTPPPDRAESFRLRETEPPPSWPAARVQVRRLGGCPCRCGDAQGTRGPMWTHVQGEACASAGTLGTRVCGGSHVCGHLWITDIGPRARPLRFVLESSPNVNLGARVSMRVWACGRACVGTSVCVHV